MCESPAHSIYITKNLGFCNRKSTVVLRFFYLCAGLKSMQRVWIQKRNTNVTNKPLCYNFLLNNSGSFVSVLKFNIISTDIFKHYLKTISRVHLDTSSSLQRLPYTFRKGTYLSMRDNSNGIYWWWNLIVDIWKTFSICSDYGDGSLDYGGELRFF